MTLTGKQIDRIHRTILDAYTPDSLRRLVRVHLDENLHTVAGGTTFADQVFTLLEWAERTGRTQALVDALCADNPGNPQVAALCAEAAAWFGEGVASDEPTVGTTPIAFDWVHIPAGEFLMGSDEATDPEALDDELPQHQLYLPDFRISRVQVTNAQYKVFVDATGHECPTHWTNGSIPRSKENHPVVFVSWHDARAFCTWAGVWLPSEAEWEKAARGTDGRIWPWGDTPPTERLGNFAFSVGDTTPGARYPGGASPYGVLDMAGNADDWTGSMWGEEISKPSYGYPYEPNDGREFSAWDDSVLRVLRGGSFEDFPQEVRCAARSPESPTAMYDSIGFRVVMSGTS